MKGINNEREILEKLSQGDVNAFQIIYEEYAPRLAGYLTRFQFSQQENEDVIQDTFTRIWQKRESLHFNSSFNTFLVTIAKHIIYNQLRHAAYQKKYKAEMLALSPKASSVDNRKEIQQLINSAIKELPPKCRHIYQKSRVEGFSNSEIAKELSISKSTVENQLNKALKKIKLVLQNSGYGTLSLVCIEIIYDSIFNF